MANRQGKTPRLHRSGKPTWLWWTASKDAAWALHLLLTDPSRQMRGLLAAISGFDLRTVGHGVSADLIKEQADAAGLPVLFVQCAARRQPFDVCEEDLQHTFREIARQGAEAVAFSDLSANANKHPAHVVQSAGLEPLFPLAGLDSERLAQAMLAKGLTARICAVESKVLSPNLIGRPFDDEFLARLPADVEPCGDQGDFHTFAEWAPGWNRQVAVVTRGSIRCHGQVFANLCLSGREGWPPTTTTGGTTCDPFAYFERLGRVRAYVDKHLGDELRLDQVAAVAALAPSSFGRYFRQRVGTTFRAWLAAYRIRRACRFLRENDAPVNQVARSVGYPCGRSFRRAFRSITGYSPSQYKKLVTPPNLQDP